MAAYLIDTVTGRVKVIYLVLLVVEHETLNVVLARGDRVARVAIVLGERDGPGGRMGGAVGGDGRFLLVLRGRCLSYAR